MSVTVAQGDDRSREGAMGADRDRSIGANRYEPIGAGRADGADRADRG